MKNFNEYLKDYRSEKIVDVKTEKIPEQNVWESDLKIINRIKVIVPLKILLVCNSIVSKLDDEEFSIVTTIESRTPDTITLSENYYIPKQKVTSVSIDYLPDDYSHSVVIHRHPDGMNSFSKTDQDFINQNFELSLLYTASEYFVNGLYNLKYEDALIPIPVKTEIDYGITDIDITNIETMIFSRNSRIDSLKGNNVPPDNDDFLYSYEELFNEINELNSRVESLECELQQNRLSEIV